MVRPGWPLLHARKLERLGGRLPRDLAGFTARRTFDSDLLALSPRKRSRPLSNNIHKTRARLQRVRLGHRGGYHRASGAQILARTRGCADREAGRGQIRQRLLPAKGWVGRLLPCVGGIYRSLCWRSRAGREPTFQGARVTVENGTAGRKGPQSSRGRLLYFGKARSGRARLGGGGEGRSVAGGNRGACR